MTATVPSNLPLDAALQQAIAHHRAGRLQEAEQLYRAILLAEPSHSDANHNLGVLAGQVGQHAAALPYLKAALALDPSQEQCSPSYAEALLATGQAKEALNILQIAMQQRGFDTPAAARALRQRIEAAAISSTVSGEVPTPVEVTQLVTLFDARRYVELEALARLLVEKHQGSGLAWKALGTSLQMQGKDALFALQKAAELMPDDAETHSTLGAVLKKLGQLDNAVASYRRALRIKPDYAEAHSNLGNSLKDLGQVNEAMVSYRRALETKPDLAETHNNLGNLLRDLGQIDDAMASCRRALEIRPDFALAHNNLGLALQDLGQLDEAIANYRRALEIKPDLALAHNNLGNALGDLGQLDDAAASYRKALQINPDYADAHSNLLFNHNYLSDQPAEMLLADARRFGDLVARQARPHTDWRNVPEAGRCLRVGLVSGDLRIHPVGYFVEGMLEALASDASGKLEIVAYPNHFRTDVLTERIKACCRGWHSAVGLSDESLARRIRDDGIDILIDLSGHTAHNRLPMFAWKPAPVQASWLGYFATTGVAAIDYLIADPWTVPEAEETQFTEKIWRLPETRLCFTPPDVSVGVAPLPALNNGYVTFGCFNNLTKMNDAVVALWARVLQAVPGSRLFLKTKQLGEATVQQSVIGRFFAHGVGADRLILERSEARSTYLSAYHRVDIALDPFPFPGGTVTAECLWMGVPVLTLAGDRLLCRQGVGLLMNVGLPDWIAADADAYVASAISHAGDLQGLATLRNGLRQQVLASPLFDAPRFARHFEAALRGMWTQWCDGKTKSMTGETYPTRTFLHVGCGPKRKDRTTKDFNTPDWNELRLDIDESVNPDIVGSMLDMRDVEDASVDAVFSSHNIEHLYPHEVAVALAEFRRVLKDDGFVVLTCPDLQSVCALIAEDKLTDHAYTSLAGSIAPLDILYGHRPSMARNNLFMAHHCGFTQKVLTGTLQAAGFASVASMRRGDPFYDLYAVATKVAISESDLRALAEAHFPA